MREQIDAQIAFHEAAIIHLKRKRNESSYISRLPPEVLCKIFLAHAEQQGLETESLAMVSFQQRTAHWIKATSHVCKRWRDVGLSCPALWSNITFSSSAWASAMLERSKQVPISVNICGSSPKAEAVITKALSQVSRLKSLIIGDSTAFVQNQLRNMTAEVPCLQSLQLDNQSYGLPILIPSTLPANFLAGGSPRLRRVSILGWRASWTSHFLRGLTSLKWSISEEALAHGALRSTATPISTSADFVSALRNMPMLEELDLDNAFPTFAARGRPASLAHLKILRLAGTAEQCTGALNCMALPPSTVLELVFHSDGRTIDSTVNVPALLTALHLCWMSNPLAAPNSLPPFASLQVVEEGSPGQPDIRFFTQHIDSNMLEDPPAIPALTLSIRWYEDTALQQIISTFPLSNLSSLYMRLAYGNDGGTMQPTRLAALQSMVLYGTSALRFVEVLKEDPAFRPIRHPTERHDDADLGKPTHSPVAVTYFPALKSLKLSQVNFVDKINGDSDDALDVEDLRDVLIWRSEHGSGLERLSLDWCYDLFVEDVDRLSKVVVSVDWDGVEQSRYDSEDDDHRCNILYMVGDEYGDMFNGF